MFDEVNSLDSPLLDVGHHFDFRRSLRAFLNEFRKLEMSSLVTFLGGKKFPFCLKCHEMCRLFVWGCLAPHYLPPS